MAVSIYIPTNSARGFPFLHILSSIVCRFFDDGHSDRCEVIPHCSFFFFFNLFIYFWLCWVFVSVQGLSLVVASGGHSSSWCAGLSLSRPLLLRSTGSRCTGSAVVAHGPSCSAACGIFPDQGSNPFPCIGRQILNHCATREALDTSILLHFLFENILHLSFPF